MEEGDRIGGWRRGRGSDRDPANRFERLRHVPFSEDREPAGPTPSTRLIDDASRTVLTRNRSPDIPYAVGLNPYRGCEHGCSYCYARPYHEYLGMSPGLEFETRILVKREAARLLRAELSAPGWEPQTIGMSGVTDCYQPVERGLGITRACLAVLAEFRNPVGLITKNRLVTRDLDHLAALAAAGAAKVAISLTTLDAGLCGRLEPRASDPRARLATIRELAEAGIPVGVNVAPVIPGLTDHELPAILAAAADAGAGWAAMSLVRLPGAVDELFAAWLDAHVPTHRDKVLARIAAIHGGARDDARFGRRMSGEGVLARQLRDLFDVHRRRRGLAATGPELSAAAFRPPHGRQLSLF